MKLTIIILLFSVNAFAVENWRAVGKSEINYINDKARCERVEDQECFDITNKNPAYHVVSHGFYVFDAALKAIYDAKILAENDKGKDLEDNKVALVGLYQAIDSANTVPQLKAILKRLTKHVLRE